MVDLVALKAEIDTDPLARGYSGMNDQAVAVSLNETIDRDAPANPSAIYEYLVTTEFRNATLYGRVGMVADCQMAPTRNNSGAITGWELPQLPLGNAGALVAMDWRMVASAKALIRLTGEDGGQLTVPLTNTVLDNLLTEMNLANANVMQASDVDAIKALSQNKQSRGAEIGLGNVNADDVRLARALP